MSHVLYGTQLRTHIRTQTDPGLTIILIRTHHHIQVDPGLTVTSSYRDGNIYTGLIVHSWGVSVALVVLLWGVINAFYAITTLAFSVACTHA